MTYLTRLTTCCWLLWSLAGLSVARAQDYSDIGLKPHAAYSDSNIDHLDLATGNVVGTIPIVSYPQLGHLPPLTFSVIFNTSPWHIEETCDTYGDQCVAYYVADWVTPATSSLIGGTSLERPGSTFNPAIFAVRNPLLSTTRSYVTGLTVRIE